MKSIITFLLVFLNCYSCSSQVLKNSNHSDVIEKENKKLVDSMFYSLNLSFEKSFFEKKYKGKETVSERMKLVSENSDLDAYRLMMFGKNIGGLIKMYEVTEKKKYMKEAVNIVNSVLLHAKKGEEIVNNLESFKDDYKGWAYAKTGKETPLFEGRFLRYVAQMTFILRIDKNFKEDPFFIDRSNFFLDYLRIHGWEKWYIRGNKKQLGCYPFLFRSRTHMTSHWAIVALYLRELSQNQREIEQYEDFLIKYDKQLRDNLKIVGKNTYYWNMTWDNPWPYGSKCHRAAIKSLPQDVAHGNHVVAYVVEAYKMKWGKWNKEDLTRFCNTVKYLVYDKKKERFNAYLDGRFKKEFADGIRMSDGFQSLIYYDRDLYEIFKRVLVKQKKNYRFRVNEPQYIAEYLLATKKWSKNKYNE